MNMSQVEQVERKKKNALRRWKDAEVEIDQYRERLSQARVRALRARMEYEDAAGEIARTYHAR